MWRLGIVGAASIVSAVPWCVGANLQISGLPCTLRPHEPQWEGGDVVGTVETTARWIAHYPLDEAAHRRRMVAFFVSGDRAAALQAYKKCQTILATELNAAPAPETEALAERMRVEHPPALDGKPLQATLHRSEEHTSELQ